MESLRQCRWCGRTAADTSFHRGCRSQCTRCNRQRARAPRCLVCDGPVWRGRGCLRGCLQPDPVCNWPGCARSGIPLRAHQKIAVCPSHRSDAEAWVRVRAGAGAAAPSKTCYVPGCYSASTSGRRGRCTDHQEAWQAERRVASVRAARAAAERAVQGVTLVPLSNCTVPGCLGTTTGRKAYCARHIHLEPYVAKIHAHRPRLLTAGDRVGDWIVLEVSSTCSLRCSCCGRLELVTTSVFSVCAHRCVCSLEDEPSVRS